MATNDDTAPASGGESDSPVREGDIVASKYRVDGLLGAGGMGVVVAATHIKLGTRVAIKFLRPSAANVAQAAERFMREARAAARIESEHVARVTDVAALDSGEPYMVMEFLRGVDLAARVRKDGPLRIDSAIEYVLQACEAIAEAHATGIVHRDLKPSNLFLTQRADGSPLVKVLDFGISKALDNAPSSLVAAGITGESSSIGSPLYMSPEQIRSAGGVDHRTDIWSLGVVLYELLVGRPPFTEHHLPALYLAIAQDPAPKLRAKRPDAPEALEAVVARCLEKDRALRIQTIAELAKALSPVAPPNARVSIERIARLGGARSPHASTLEPAGLDVHAPTIPSASQPIPLQLAAKGTASASDGATRESPRAGATLGNWAGTGGGSVRRVRRRALVAVAAASILVVAIFAWTRSPPRSASTSTTTPTPTPNGTVRSEAQYSDVHEDGRSPPAVTPTPTSIPDASAKTGAPHVIVKPPVPPPVPTHNGLDDRN